jgi:acyl-coenzyme A synthetase/AMP-(fatty) acid ligase
MSLCAIIPANLMQSANDALKQQGFGAGNFSVPLYGSTGATYGGLHTWGNLPFETAVKAIVGVVWEQSDGDPTTRFNALVEAHGVKWGANAPQYPTTGTITAGQMYRYTDDTLWQVIQQYDVSVFSEPPSTYPALIRQVREPYTAIAWKQPIDQFDAYKLINPFTNKPDECLFDGKRWQPSVFGWAEIL